MASAGWVSAFRPYSSRLRDDALALRPDVDEDLVLVDPDDGALDDVAVLEALDVGVLLGEQLLHRGRLGAEVADGLRRLLGLGGGGRIGDLGGQLRRRPRLARPTRRRRPRRFGLGGGGLLDASTSATSRASTAASAAGSAFGVVGSGGVGQSVDLGRSGGLELGSSAATSSTMSAIGSAVGSSAARPRRRLGISAGSSATATAAWGASSVTAAVASVSGAVPPCCCSVNLIVSPARMLPENQNGPSDDSGRERRSAGPVLAGPRSAPSCRMALGSRSSAVLPARAGRV